MTITQESSTPPTIDFPDTSVYVSLLVTAGTDATVNDNGSRADLVSIRLDGCGEATLVHLSGSLADVQRLVDDIAHQLMLVSTRRGAAEEEGERARGLAGVAELRQAAADARAEAVGPQRFVVTEESVADLKRTVG